MRLPIRIRIRTILIAVVLFLTLACNVFSATTLTFKDFVSAYWNQPGVTIDSITASTGTSRAAVVEFVTYAQRKNYEKIIAAGEVITSAELLAAWDKDHPAVVCRQTPFGLYCIPAAEKLVGELTVTEFEALLTKHTGK